MRKPRDAQIDLFAPGACMVPKLAPDLPIPAGFAAQFPRTEVTVPAPVADDLPAPRHPAPGATQSIAKAMELLVMTRADLIARARAEAVALARASGTVTSRQVRLRMAELHLVRADASEFWLGAVFRTSDFEWTGRYDTYSDAERNIHERTIKIWRLRGEATKPRRRSSGPENCPRRCSECPDGGHHTGDSYTGFATDEPDHPAAKIGIDVWWTCKHCPAWFEMLDDDDDGGPT